MSSYSPRYQRASSFGSFADPGALQPPPSSSTMSRYGRGDGGIAPAPPQYAPPGSYASRYQDTHDADYPRDSTTELLQSEWARKPSRQRRFTSSSLPLAHLRDEAAYREIEQGDYESKEREEELELLKDQVSFSAQHVQAFAEQKEKEWAMFDENGNYLQQFDEDGNPLPLPRDEEGYEIREERFQKNISLDSKEIAIKAGWMYKKGSGIGAGARRNWTKRFFILDMQNPRFIYYLKSQPLGRDNPVREKDPTEDLDTYYQTIHDAWINTRRRARGKIDILYAQIVVPTERRHHKASIMGQIGDNEFDVVQLTSYGEIQRTYNVCPFDVEEKHLWIKTLGYILKVLGEYHERKKRGGLRMPRLQIDEVKQGEALLCFAHGQGLFEAVAGQPAQFIIQAPQPGLKFNCVLESQTLHYDLNVDDLGDSTYLVKYIPTRTGAYELTVMLEDYDIQMSPFTPIVKAAPVSAPHCTADGPGLYCAVVGMINSFVIFTRNTFNDHVVAHGVPFEVRAHHPLVLYPFEDGSTLKDNRNGSFTVQYIVDVKPDVQQKLDKQEHIDTGLEVLLNDNIHEPSFLRHIKGSPFRPAVAASASGADLAIAAKQYARYTGSLGFGIGSLERSMSFRAPSSPFVPPVPVWNMPLAPAATTTIPPPLQQQQQQQLPSTNLPSHPQHSYYQLASDAATVVMQRGNGNTTGSRSAVSSFLPARPPAAAQQYLPSSTPRQQQTQVEAESSSLFPTSSILEQQRMHDADKEELLRLRRELQEGRHLVEEQVGRMADVGRKVKADSERILDRTRTRMGGMSMLSGGGGETSISSRLRNAAANPTSQPDDYSSSPWRAPIHPQPSSGSRSATTNATTNSARKPTTPLASSSFDTNVVALFNKHAAALKRVFRHYATRDVADDSDMVRLAGFIKCTTDFDITPTFSSRKEVRDAFERAAAKGGGGGDALNFPSFVEALAHVAIDALAKPMFAHLYTTNASRVSVLLVMWGLGDPTTLDGIVAKARYAA